MASPAQTKHAQPQLLEPLPAAKHVKTLGSVAGGVVAS